MLSIRLQQIERAENRAALEDILPDIQNGTWARQLEIWNDVFDRKSLNFSAWEKASQHWERTRHIARTLVFARFLISASDIDPNYQSINLQAEKKLAAKFCENAAKFFGTVLSENLSESLERQRICATKLPRQILSEQQKLLWEEIFSGEKKLDESLVKELTKNWEITRKAAISLIQIPIPNPDETKKLKEIRDNAISFCQKACNYFGVPYNAKETYKEQQAFISEMPHQADIHKKLTEALKKHHAIKLLEERQNELTSPPKWVPVRMAGLFQDKTAQIKAELLKNLMSHITHSEHKKSLLDIIKDWEQSPIASNQQNKMIQIGQHRSIFFSQGKTKTQELIEMIKDRNFSINYNSPR